MENQFIHYLFRKRRLSVEVMKVAPIVVHINFNESGFQLLNFLFDITLAKNDDLKGVPGSNLLENPHRGGGKVPSSQ